MGKKNIGEERIALAGRLRQIRKNLGYTQEQFAEILGISLPAYKKLENGENQITVDGLRTLNKKLNVSADFLLFGTYSDMNETWKGIQNCSEHDKMLLMLRMFAYFSKAKDAKFLSNDILKEMDEKILQIID